MKYFVFVIVLLFAVNSLVAQFVLSSNNAPKAEHKYYFIEADLNMDDAIVTGQNIVWDMTGITKLQDTLVEYYTTDTNYNSFPTYDYPDSFFDTSLYNLKSQQKLFKVTDDRFSLGYSLVPVLDWGYQACGIDKTILPFPFSYNDSIVQNWNCGQIDLAFRKIKAVGYGKLLLNSNTYDTVLLVHTFERREYDPSPINPHSIYDTVYEDTFNWYAIDENVPVLSIRYNLLKRYQEGHTDFYYDTLTYIYHGKTDLTAVAESKIVNNRMTIYPNPSSGTFNIIYFAKRNGSYTIKLIDLHNKNAFLNFDFIFTHGKNEFLINSGSITKGIYILQIEFDGLVLSTKKILIQ